MSLYKTLKDFGKKTVIPVGLVAMLVGCSQPTLEKNKDLTGDKIPDAIVNINVGFQSGTWLFIGQENGSFIRAKQYESDGVKYFKTNDGTTYFFNGEFYEVSPKQK